MEAHKDYLSSGSMNISFLNCQIKNDLESYKGKCRALEEKLECVEEDAEQVKGCRFVFFSLSNKIYELYA